jgi:ribosomal protein S18 acetylase RimI-like enzyme
MSLEWRVRAAGPDDAGALALIGAATFIESYAEIVDGKDVVMHCAREHAPDYYTRALAKGGKAWLVEVAPGYAPIGYALVMPPELPDAGPCDIELKRIYLLSRFQGTGIGSALMAAALEASAGHDRLMLGMYKGNDNALAFYRKHGFSISGERTFTLGGSTYSDWVLSRPLQD